MDAGKPDAKASNAAALSLRENYLNGGPQYSEGGDRAYYRPSADAVVCPKLEAYKDEGEYWSTVFHELGHSTGHRSRLNRPGVDGERVHAFGSENYSKEELIAELTACFLCADVGIDDTRENSAAYLHGWAKKLGDEPRLIVTAASAAKKAADFIQNPTQS